MPPHSLPSFFPSILSSITTMSSDSEDDSNLATVPSPIRSSNGKQKKVKKKKSSSKKGSSKEGKDGKDKKMKKKEKKKGKKKRSRSSSSMELSSSGDDEEEEEEDTSMQQEPKRGKKRPRDTESQVNGSSGISPSSSPAAAEKRSKKIKLMAAPQDSSDSIFAQEDIATAAEMAAEDREAKQKEFDALGYKRVEEFGLSEQILKALHKQGYTHLFPIQQQTFEHIMEGQDLVGQAKTGTGKTLAFSLPVIESMVRLKRPARRGRNPLCVVLAPTRELANQVGQVFEEVGVGLSTTCIYGGTPYGPQGGSSLPLLFFLSFSFFPIPSSSRIPPKT